MPKNYKPPKDTADTYARYKAHYEGERALKPEMLEHADRDLKAGATVGQLAAWTGLTPEVFRRRARALGVKRKRPPTVGKLKPDQTAPQAANQPHWQGPPAHRTTPPEPPAGLHLSPEAAALSYDRAKMLAKQAEAQRPDWGMEMRRELRHVDEQWRWHVMVEAGVQAGYIDVPYEGSEETSA